MYFQVNIECTFSGYPINGGIVCEFLELLGGDCRESRSV